MSINNPNWEGKIKKEIWWLIYQKAALALSLPHSLFPSRWRPRSTRRRRCLFWVDLGCFLCLYGFKMWKKDCLVLVVFRVYFLGVGFQWFDEKMTREMMFRENMRSACCVVAISWICVIMYFGSISLHYRFFLLFDQFYGFSHEGTKSWRK